MNDITEIIDVLMAPELIAFLSRNSLQFAVRFPQLKYEYPKIEAQQYPPERAIMIIHKLRESTTTVTLSFFAEQLQQVLQISEMVNRNQRT